MYIYNYLKLPYPSKAISNDSGSQREHSIAIPSLDTQAGITFQDFL